MRIANGYEDLHRARAYDQLELGGTYHLAFRDLAAILCEHVSGDRAVDFGCGTGRSSRWLTEHGFRVTGVDISHEMVTRARWRDPHGDYRIVPDGDLSSVEGEVDLLLCAFTFDNIGGRAHRLGLLASLRRLLAPSGTLVLLVSTPEIYTHEWASFSTRDFPENRAAGSGEVVRIVTTDHGDQRPMMDLLWTDVDYRTLVSQAGLALTLVKRPLATDSEGVDWVSETRIAPWAIYVCRLEVSEEHPSR